MRERGRRLTARASRTAASRQLFVVPSRDQNSQFSSQGINDDVTPKGYYVLWNEDDTVVLRITVLLFLAGPRFPVDFAGLAMELWTLTDNSRPTSGAAPAASEWPPTAPCEC